MKNRNYITCSCLQNILIALLVFRTTTTAPLKHMTRSKIVTDLNRPVHHVVYKFTANVNPDMTSRPMSSRKMQKIIGDNIGRCYSDHRNRQKFKENHAWPEFPHRGAFINNISWAGLD